MNKNTWIAVVVGICVVGFFLFGGEIVNLFNGDTNTASDAMNTDNTGTPGQTIGEPQGLVIQDQVLGTGATVANGDLVTVDYVGTLADGTKFDSSIDRGQPFQFVIGEGRVIAGWEQGLQGMKVGGTRTLIIPPSLGYGANAVGPIPANSTLIFQIKLLNVQSGQAAQGAEGAAAQ